MEKGAKVSGKALLSAPGKRADSPGLDFETWEIKKAHLLQRAFLEAPAEQVAPRLLGKILAQRIDGENCTKYLTGRIVEIEAYLGQNHETPDPAAHAHRGPTPRNQVLFGPAGHAYVYSIYGMHYCMNISCETPGKAGSVLIRALEPLAGLDQMALNRGLKPGANPVKPCQLTSGPSRLCQALGITRPLHNGLDLLDPDSPLQLRDDGFPVAQVHVTARIGITHAADLPLRFSLPNHACVSGPKRIQGNFIFLR